MSHRSRHLLGDPFGIRTDLESRGIYFLLDATAEFAGNVSGGIKQGATSANLVSAYAERTAYNGDLDVAAGWMNVENDFASSPLYCNFVNTLQP